MSIEILPRLMRKPGTILSLMLALAAFVSAAGNRVVSDGLATSAERVKVLKKYLKLRSEIQDTAFDIYDVNLDAGSSIPGPTHRDFRIALALKKADAKKWLSGLVITSFPKDRAWCDALIAGRQSLKTGHPQDVWTYTGKDKTAFYFEKDGILCLRIYQD